MKGNFGPIVYLVYMHLFIYFMGNASIDKNAGEIYYFSDWWMACFIPGETWIGYLKNLNCE